MKDKIIESIVEAIKNNRLSKNLKSFKESVEKEMKKALSPEEFAIYVFDNEIKNGNDAVAGEVELANAYAYFSQEAQGGKDEEGPFWLNIWDADTKLNYGGKAVELNELSHVINLDQWKKNVEGHRHHNPKSKVDLNVDDAKFDFDNGKLHLHINPTDKNIHKGLREGVIKPSIEVAFPDYMLDSENNKLNSYVKVKGLGLMEDGRQMGEKVGPGEPGQSAFGGKDMAEEGNDQPTEAEKFQVELKSALEKDPKAVL